MKTNKGKRLLNVGVTAYLLVILGILPLYHKEGFYRIGDMKYRLFFQVSIILVPIFLVVLGILKVLERNRSKWSLTDWCAAVYGSVVCISYLLSSYKEIAFNGYTDWHMGLLSQLLFVGIYFCVSRGFKWDVRMVWYLCAVSGFIFLLGLLNRYAFDPLGMYGGLEYWNKTHLLATIGNINWYCGYFCVFFPIGFYYYWNGSSVRWKRLLTISYVAVAFGTLLTQGSESGLVAFAVVMAAYFFFSFDSNAKMKRFLEAGVMLGIVSLLLKAAYYHWQERAYFSIDLPIIQIITSDAWIYATILILGIYLLFLYGISKKNFKIEEAKRLRNALTGICLLAASFLALAVGLHAWNPMFFQRLNNYSYLNINESWGSGRGLLWPITFRAFGEMAFQKQLFGVGPDCFAPYMYQYYGPQLQGFLEGWWGDAIVANAHNEWLNTLVNTGILGMLSYFGMLLSGLWATWKEKKENPILLAFGMSILMYLVNSTASFQQVMSTPFLFIILGMAENRRKNYLPK